MDLYLESYDGPSGVYLRDNLPHCNIQNGQNVLLIYFFLLSQIESKEVTFVVWHYAKKKIEDAISSLSE